MKQYILTTARLGMRTWRDDDLAPFAAMNQDPRVMEFFPRSFTAEESAAGLQGFNAHFEEHGFTYYAADRLDTKQFIGFIGIKWQNYEAEFTPCVDIGWRLSVDAWGHGFATEGARACLEHGFAQHGLKEIYSVAPKLNIRSTHVMQKIGMRKVGEFDHPNIPEGHALRRCEVYLKQA